MCSYIFKVLFSFTLTNWLLVYLFICARIFCMFILHIRYSLSLYFFISHIFIISLYNTHVIKVYTNNMCHENHEILTFLSLKGWLPHRLSFALLSLKCHTCYPLLFSLHMSCPRCSWSGFSLSLIYLDTRDTIFPPFLPAILRD